MAMRLTDKQREKAKLEALKDFDAQLSAKRDWPEDYFIENTATKYSHMSYTWETVFKRTDISDENKEALDKIWCETYEILYIEHMSRLYTPKTLRQVENENAARKFNEALTNIMGELS